MEEYEGRVMIKEIADFFDFKQITGDAQSLNRWVIVADINRPGLELSGYLKYSEPRRIIIIGDKERGYIEEMDEATQRERFQNLTDGYTPMIVISRSIPCPPILKEIAQSKNFPIFSTDHKTSRLMVDLVSYLDDRLAPSDSVHGVLLNIYGIGVLISGESGMGKSEIALELIRKGHQLVADDRVDVRRVHNHIIGNSTELLAGILEIRGVGLIDVTQMFGASSYLERSNVDFMIHLTAYDELVEYTRIGVDSEEYFEILEEQIPKITIPVKSGRSMAVIIEAAVTNYILKRKGFDNRKEFEKKLYGYIEKQNVVGGKK